MSDTNRKDSTSKEPIELHYSVAEAAGQMGLCTKTVYSMIRDGDLPGTAKFRKEWRIPASAIARYFNLVRPRPSKIQAPSATTA